MQAFFRTDHHYHAARGAIVLAGALLLTACAEGDAQPADRDVDDTADGPDETVTRSGGDLDAGARSSRDATTPSRSDASAAADAGLDAGGGGGDTCGDVTAADHPAFEAIKKLATTDDEVRVLVYGQSISEQAWWEDTKRWLEQTYPNGKLVMEEHARGGCAAQCLIGHAPWSDGQQYNRLPEDVFAWKPDLVIFHVFGDHNDYGYVMRGLKEGCAAFDDYETFDGKQVPQVRCTDAQRAMSAGYRAPEVLVQNDFVKPSTNTDCPADPGPSNWDCYMNEKIIPEQVAQHGYRLQDNFSAWRSYAAGNGLDPAALINKDDTHLSEPAGTDVMFSLTVPHLCYAP